MTSMVDPPIDVENGELRIVHPGTNRMIDDPAQFSRLFCVLREFVPFGYMDHDPWELLAASKRVFEEAEPTLCTLGTGRYRECVRDAYDGEIPTDTSLSVYMKQDFMATVGVYQSPEGSASRWVNPYYCHDSARPRPGADAWEEVIMRHLRIGNHRELPADHLGCEPEEISEFCLDRWGFPYAGMAESAAEKRRRSIALAVAWGTDPETVAYVEDKPVESVEYIADQHDVGPNLLDITARPGWWGV